MQLDVQQRIDMTNKLLRAAVLEDIMAANRQRILPPFRLTTVGRRSFPVASSLLWNSLPSDIQSSSSLPVFRQRLKHFYSGYHFLILYCDATMPLWSL